MKEICVRFGDNRHLVGTLAMPAGGPNQPIGFILMNAGVIHRAGPHRFNVKLARRLRDCGIASLRFDLSGQGDSGSPAAAAPYEKQAIIDIRAAIDHFERLTGIHHFAIAGICSGADHGLAAAAEDTRIAALWMMDGHTYPTAKTKRMRYLRRLRRGFVSTAGRRIWRWIAALPGRTFEKAQDEQEGASENRYARSMPSAVLYANALQSLTDRQVSVFLMFSGSVLERYNYAGQLRDAFRGHAFVDEVRCDYAPHIDHSITTLAAQDEVTGTICSWAKQIRLPDLEPIRERA